MHWQFIQGLREYVQIGFSGPFAYFSPHHFITIYKMLNRLTEYGYIYYAFYFRISAYIIDWLSRKHTLFHPYVLLVRA